MYPARKCLLFSSYVGKPGRNSRRPLTSQILGIPDDRVNFNKILRTQFSVFPFPGVLKRHCHKGFADFRSIQCAKVIAYLTRTQNAPGGTDYDSKKMSNDLYIKFAFSEA